MSEKMDEREIYIKLLLDVKRDGIHDMLDWLMTTDFFSAPASTRFHGSYPHGLLKHHLNVYDELIRLKAAYPEIVVSDDSAKIIALCHDFCKINFYTTEKRNRKNASGQWETYDSYSIKEKFCFGGHGSKSVFLVQHFIKLTPEEAVAINCHMGAWDGNKDVGNAYEQYPLAWLLHVADEAACYVSQLPTVKTVGF